MKAIFALFFLVVAVMLLILIDKLKRNKRPPGYGMALSWKRYPKGWTKKLW